MATPELIIPSVSLLIFGLLMVLAVFRWRSKWSVMLHLFLYSLLGFLANLLILTSSLDIIPPSYNYSFLNPQLALLATSLLFGALSLTFLRNKLLVLYIYWGAVIALLALWVTLATNFRNSSETTLAYLSRSYFSNITDNHHLLLGLVGLGWFVSITTVLTNVISDFQKPHPTQYINRLRYWLIITALLTGAGIVFLFDGTLSTQLLGLPLLITGSVLIGYIVLSYHTPDLKLLIGWGIHYLAVLLSLSTLTLLAMGGILYFNRQISDPLNLLFVAVLLAISLTIFYRPLHHFSKQLFTKFIFGKTLSNEREIIKRYSQKLSTTLDLQRLSDVTANLMVDTLNTDRTVVFVNEREDEMSVRPFSFIGLNSIETRRFARESPFVDYFYQHDGEILSQYDIDVRPNFRSMDKSERQWLADLGIELYVPMIRQEELLGILAFGPHPQGTAYGEEEKDLMVTLANQTGLAMEGARLFQQLATVNEEVGLLTDRLAILDQSKSDFLSIASHELRTPLNLIHSYTQLLLEVTDEGVDDQAQLKRMIQGIAKGSERLKDIVDTMMDVTEADLGVMSLFSGPVDIKQVIKQAIKPFQPALEERNLTVHQDNLERLPKIEADGTRLVQAFENLIGNAIKYTPDGKAITVSGRALNHKELGAALEIAVIDKGIGIDPEHHKTVFEKFFRVDDTMHHSTGKTKFKGAGPGLGLTLVKAIAEAHKGRVWVESPGQDEENFPGSTFYFLIPLPDSIYTQATLHDREAISSTST